MNEKPEALRLVNVFAVEKELCRQDAEIERLADENERLHDELRQSSIDITRAEVERLKAENERLREALAWAYNLRHLRGHSDPVVIPERFAPLIDAALRREET